MYNDSIMHELSCLKSCLLSIDNKLRTLRDAQVEFDTKYTGVICQMREIASDASFMTNPVNNPGFSRCRLEASLGFNENSNAGIELSLIYGNSIIGKMSDIISSNGASIYISEPINVKQLSGFQFQFKNRDMISVIINNAKIIFYNE